MVPWLVATLAVGSPVAYEVRKVGDVPCRVITANLRDPRVRVGILCAVGFPNADEPFLDMVARSRPVAAINGAYFDKFNFQPIGDVVTDGRKVFDGRMGTALAFDEQGNPDIGRVTKGRTVDWTGYRNVLGCGPALMLDGRIDVQFEAEGFRHPSVVGRTPRMGVGYTSAGKLLLVNADKPITFAEFAVVMQRLGCYEAMNLDAGASRAMWFRGKQILRPGRKLTTVLAVFVDPGT